jgi:alpha-L-rhamnosidase
MRVLIKEDPNVDRSAYKFTGSPWPAQWVGHADQMGQKPVVIAYRCRFSASQDEQIRIHVSADERYELFLDGVRIGRGPERGDVDNWFYETHDLTLTAGDHTLVARTWWLGEHGPSPLAQQTVRPAFWLMAEGSLAPMLDTGVGKWQCMEMPGYGFIPPSLKTFIVVGARTKIDGHKFPWGFERGEGSSWIDVTPIARAFVKSLSTEDDLQWLLRPALLPEMMSDPVHTGKTRHVSTQPPEAAVKSSDHLGDEAVPWDKLLTDSTPLMIPANTNRRVIIDLENYYCVYPQLLTTGGDGAQISTRWAESLYDSIEKRTKGNRDEIEGKFFQGIGDHFDLDGGENRLYEPLWWDCGRYLEVMVQTATQPLTIQSLHWLETRFPIEFTSTFDTSDTRLGDVITPSLRALQMCMHETYFDCPYYEQLMYVGDTRCEVLTTYVNSADDRLPRKAVEMFDLSRQDSGLTWARYPCRSRQTIPPFSLWWVQMVHDYAMWRDDPAFVKARMPGVRAVLDAWCAGINRDGVAMSPDGWNYVDWVPKWDKGIPPGAHHGPSSILNWQLIWTLMLSAELEALVNEPELAARDLRLATSLASSTDRDFWDQKRGLFADDLTHEHFSEHAQCLAILSGKLDPMKKDRLSKSLFADTDLARTTIYFTHYLFETCRVTERMDVLFDRLKLWTDLKTLGFKTTFESPEPSRSDCHAWGAHPVFHFYATILGIRPAAPGFSHVEIRPQLGALTRASGNMVHPKGIIHIELQHERESLHGAVTLPAGVEGTFIDGKRRIALKSGANNIPAS